MLICHVLTAPHSENICKKIAQLLLSMPARVKAICPSETAIFGHRYGVYALITHHLVRSTSDELPMKTTRVFVHGVSLTPASKRHPVSSNAVSVMISANSRAFNRAA